MKGTGVAIPNTRGMKPGSVALRRKLLAYLDTLKLPDGVKAIPLNHGRYALVDASDYEFLMQWNWQYRDGYAKRTVYGQPGRRVIGMHSAIVNAPEGFEPDHRNNNRLDNRRQNLRLATHQQNMWNRSPVAGSSSKYKGVDWYAASGSWRAYIKVNGKQKHLGCYETEDDAARAYNKAATEIHGEFARLNPVTGDPAPRIRHPYQDNWNRKRQESHDRL